MMEHLLLKCVFQASPIVVLLLLLSAFTLLLLLPLVSPECWSPLSSSLLTAFRLLWVWFAYCSGSLILSSGLPLLLR
jgi:hypothetical protein